MEIIDEITKNIKICLNNKIDEMAIENIFYAKFCHLMQLKNITFTSINNLKKPSLLSYYAINFVSSGGAKNQTISHIDSFLLPFVEDEHYKIENEIKSKVIADEKEFFEGDKNYQQECKKIDKYYKDKTIMSFKTNGGTPAVLYDKNEKIVKYGKGAMFAQITEFADYFSGSVDNSQSSNKGFLNLINNLYDGIQEPSDSLGTKRKELHNIPFALLFLSDIEDLLEEKNNRNFKKSLKSGWSRRINFYFDKKINYLKNPPKKPTQQEKLEAYSNLNVISNKLKGIYNKIDFNQSFVFSAEANDLIEEWMSLCDSECAKFYEYTDKLSLDDRIKVIELQNSAWKIIKNAVLMQLLLDSNSLYVSQLAVLKSIEFYKKCRDCLYSILDEKDVTPEIMAFNFFLQNQNKEFNLTDLKLKAFVPFNEFSLWFKKSFIEIESLLDEKGYELIVTKNRKSQIIKCVKQIKPEETKINISISNENVEHPSKEYQALEVNTDEFIELIKNTKAFSAQQFKNGHRKDCNIIGNQNTIWLDFDDGLTIEQAKEQFKDYWYIIYTSINHQKNKGDKCACDRFRLILKTKNYLPKDKEEYNSILSNICKKYKSDMACKDLSRYYRGNKNAIIFKNDGAFFDWEEFKIEPKKKIKQKEFINEVAEIDETNIDVILKADEIKMGNRDASLSYSIGVLIEAVKNNQISHQNAKIWLENKLNEIMTPDFKENAKKYRKRLERLEF